MQERHAGERIRDERREKQRMKVGFKRLGHEKQGLPFEFLAMDLNKKAGEREGGRERTESVRESHTQHNIGEKRAGELQSN